MQTRSNSIGALIAWLLFSMNAWGDTSTEPTILGPDVQGTKVGPGADFSGKKLNGSQFVMEDLSGAVFDDADFAGSMFLECDLTGASFRNTSLTAVSIGDCNMSGADFTGAAITDIKPAGGLNSPNMYLAPEQLLQTRSLKRKTLKGYAFPRGTLGNQKDLRGFDLRGTHLVGGDFRDVQFDGARIAGARFTGKVQFEQLRNTVEVAEGRFPAYFYSHFDCDLSGLDLRDSEFHFPPGIRFNLTDALIDDCQLWFGGNRATEALASTRSYRDRAFRLTAIRHADLSGIKLDEMILERVRFSDVDLGRASFRDTIFMGANLTAVDDSLQIDQLEQTWNFKNGLMEEFRLPDRLKLELTSTKRTGP